MDGREVATGRMHRPPPWYSEVAERRRVPYCEVLEFNVETGRGLAILEDALVVFAGTPHIPSVT